jgi:hypothetical protein
MAPPLRNPLMTGMMPSPASRSPVMCCLSIPPRFLRRPQLLTRLASLPVGGPPTCSTMAVEWKCTESLNYSEEEHR